MNDLRESYWRKLGRHPGLPFAVVLPLAGAFAGLGRGGYGWLWGALIMASVSLFPVLITARSLPHE